MIFLGIGIYYWLRKKESKKGSSKLAKVLGNSDYQRLITIAPLKCLDCGECILVSNGCCANCMSNITLENTETHCHEHNHKHYHHSNYETKELLTLFLLPLISGIITYQIIRKITQKSTKK